MFPGSKSNTDQVDDDVSSLNANIQTAWAQAQVYNNNSPGFIDPNDRRMHYALVGANWMDKPAVFDTNRPFQNNIPDPSLSPSSPLQVYTNPLLISVDGGVPPGPPEQSDPANAGYVGSAQDRTTIWNAGGLQAAVQDLLFNGSDSPFSILGGEERMSSTAMESFTQDPSSFFNCFQCHNTLAVSVNGVPTMRDPAPTPLELLPPKRINVSHVFSQFVLEQCTVNDSTLRSKASPALPMPAACPQP
ncbi:MAG: hypothetical protein JOZ69_21410 [Myxococcales bacterium]|nr:hypothetical protein [Myxococcales bacterium]